MKKLVFIPFIYFASLAASGQNLSDSLALYLPFTGNTSDSSGNSYTVTNNGATLAADRFGNENSAYYFNGSANMSIPIEQHLPNVNEDGYTVSFWVKQDTAAADGGYMMSYGYWNGLGGFSFQYREGTAQTENYSVAIHQESGSETIYFNRYNIFAHGWNMVSFTYTNGTLRGYVNGCFTEELSVTAFINPGSDFVIGDRFDYSNGITGWIDEVYVYNRALSDQEVAQLSGLSGAIRAADFHAYTLSDFELGELEPVKLGQSWNTYGATGGAHPDYLSYIKTAKNPLKAGDNTSEYVGMAVTFPTHIQDLFNYPSRKMEYYIDTKEDEMNDRHHIMQWKAMYPDSTIFEVDSMRWLTQNQIHGDFQLFAPPCYGTGQIAGGTGGIFNENSIELESYTSKTDRNNFRFFYRAMPDSANIFYTMDIGQWVTFTYEIFWTASDTGYWRLYKDGALLSSRDNVKTLPDCAPVSGLRWKTGSYTRWNDYVDNEIDSLTFYFDDLELYVEPEISVYDICPKCEFNPCDTSRLVITESIQHENGNIALTVSGGVLPYTYFWNNGSESKNLTDVAGGTYTVNVTDQNGCSERATYLVDRVNAIDNTAYSATLYLFPNPANDRLTIRGATEPDRITLYTTDGRIVRHTKNTNTIDVSGLSQGVYIAAIKINDALICRKFIKN